MDEAGDMLEEALEIDSTVVTQAFNEGYLVGTQEFHESSFREGFVSGYTMSRQVAALANNVLKLPEEQRMKYHASSISRLLSELKLENSDESAALLSRIVSKYKILEMNKKYAEMK